MTSPSPQGTSAADKPVFTVHAVPIGTYTSDVPNPFPEVAADEEARAIARLLEPYGGVASHWDGTTTERTRAWVQNELGAWARRRQAGSSVLVWVGCGESDGSQAWLASFDSVPGRSNSAHTPAELAEYVYDEWSTRSQDPGAWTLVVIEAVGAGEFVQQLAAAVLARPHPVERIAFVGAGGRGISMLGSVSQALSGVLNSFTDNDDTIKVEDLVARLDDRLDRGNVISLHLGSARVLQRTRLLPDMSIAPLLPETSITPQLLAGAAADTVPEPGEGRVRHADRLGAAVEVEMLVSVLLAQDTPLPLAVGLFGGWGSGKSFFMALMQERMNELALLAKQGRPEAAPFCREVRQVRFNAWHYVDTNLWASLAAALFDQLAAADAPQDAQTKQAQLDEAREKAKGAREKRLLLEREVDELTVIVERPTSAVRTTVALAIRAVRGEPQLRAALRDASRGEIVDDSTERLVSVLGEVEDAAGRSRAAWRLFQEEVLYRRRRTTLVTLFLLVGLAIIAPAAARWTMGVRFLTLCGAVVAALTPALSGTLRVLYLVREARETRELPLVKKRDELARAEVVEHDAKSEVARCERELEALQENGLQWREFVRERAASPVYRDKLGLISQMRLDIEKLVSLVPNSKPAESEQLVMGVAALAQTVPDVERIVLFIDDLDRCPHDKVVEVLQAVHLLLAFKLFVVVVGVDSEWLERSLRAHYRSLLGEPANYLEKIFQIPFTLRRMTPDQYRDLIEKLTPTVGNSGLGFATSNSDVTSDDAGHRTQDIGAAGTLGGNAGDPDPWEARPLPRPEALVISNAERTLLGQLGAIIPTPRAAKRLTNIYRMLRVSVPEDELEAFRSDGGDDYQAVVLLLGILVGRPSMAREVFAYLIDASDDDDLWQVLGKFPKVYEPLTSLRKHMTVTTVGPLRHWVPRVSRFSFRLADVLPMDEEAPQPLYE